jgi:hypothetical protein
MMEQAADNKRGRRAIECSGSGVGDGGDDKGRDSRGKGEVGIDGCSKCNGNSSGDGDGRGDGGGHDDSCIEGNGIGNAATAAGEPTKAAAMMEAKAMAAAWLQGQQQQQHDNNITTNTTTNTKVLQ